jgi:DNA mismatch repair protein MutS2
MPAKTLELLEWPRLAAHLSTFTQTKLGSLVAQRLVPPDALAESLHLLQQTQEVVELESHVNGSLSFDGIQDIGPSLARVSLQGILNGFELLHIATTLSAARQLRRTVDRFPELVNLNRFRSADVPRTGARDSPLY